MERPVHRLKLWVRATATLKWLGFALIGIALIALPIVIWISDRLGLLFATIGTLGCVLLGFAFGRRPQPEPELAPEPEAGPEDKP